MAIVPLSEPPRALDASEPMGRTVLVVGVDFSEMSEHLLYTARDLVRLVSRAELHVVHVVPVQSIAAGFIDSIPNIGPSVADGIELAHRRLEETCRCIANKLQAHLITHVRVGSAVDEIPRLAAEVGADLIVVEAHGRTGLKRMLHRSVAAQLARNAPCSVLTVRPKAPAGASLQLAEPQMTTATASAEASAQTERAPIHADRA